MKQPFIWQDKEYEVVKTHATIINMHENHSIEYGEWDKENYQPCLYSRAWKLFILLIQQNTTMQ
jgi:hypothetical protein